MANKPILVVMAAGMGSRYGGLKQIDPVGTCGGHDHKNGFFCHFIKPPKVALS